MDSSIKFKIKNYFINNSEYEYTIKNLQGKISKRLKEYTLKSFTPEEKELYEKFPKSQIYLHVFDGWDCFDYDKTSILRNSQARGYLYFDCSKLHIPYLFSGNNNNRSDMFKDPKLKKLLEEYIEVLTEYDTYISSIDTFLNSVTLTYIKSTYPECLK